MEKRILRYLKKQTRSKRNAINLEDLFVELLMLLRMFRMTGACSMEEKLDSIEILNDKRWPMWVIRDVFEDTAKGKTKDGIMELMARKILASYRLNREKYILSHFLLLCSLHIIEGESVVWMKDYLLSYLPHKISDKFNRSIEQRMEERISMEERIRYEQAVEKQQRQLDELLKTAKEQAEIPHIVSENMLLKRFEKAVENIDDKQIICKMTRFDDRLLSVVLLHLSVEVRSRFLDNMTKRYKSYILSCMGKIYDEEKELQLEPALVSVMRVLKEE